MTGFELAVTPPAPAGRLLYIDNLRWTMIVLVISMHAADTYSPLGNWYFVDRVPLSLPVLLFFAGWEMYLQSFFMGLLFFAAGYFVPGSFDRKGPGRFLRERGFRLGLPVLFYMFVLGPVTEYYVAHSWNSTLPTSMANEWVKHIRNRQFLQENGPLWFCLALLIFSVCYAGLRIEWGERRARGTEAAPGDAAFVGFALGMAALSFLVRLGRPAPVLNMHVGDFPQYVLLFAAGIQAARGRWLERLTRTSAMRWFGIVVPGGFLFWLVLIFAGGALCGNGAAYSGGWHWQSAAVDLWESFTCVAISIGLLVWFREKWDRQGRLARFLSANAFSVYVFHPPVVIAGARLMHGFAWPPMVKFVLLTGFAAVATFVLSAAVFRRIPLLRAIL